MIQNNSHPQTAQPDLILTKEDSKGSIEEHSGGDHGNDPIPNEEGPATSASPAGVDLLALARAAEQAAETEPSTRRSQAAR